MNKIQQVSELMNMGDKLWHEGTAFDRKRKYGQGDYCKAEANTLYMRADKVYLSATDSEKALIKEINS